jgi:hypothetical protein
MNALDSTLALQLADARIGKTAVEIKKLDQLVGNETQVAANDTNYQERGNPNEQLRQ